MNRIEMGLTKVRDMAHGPKTSPLAQFLNLWSMCDGVLVGVNLDFTSVHELEPASLFLMDTDAMDKFVSCSQTLLNALPADCTLQFVVRIRSGDPDALDEFRREMKSGGQNELSRLLTDKKCEFIDSKFTQRRRYYLYITSRPKGRKVPVAPLLPAFRKPWREVTRGFHEDRLREHEALERIVSERFQNLGMSLRKLSPEETLDLVFRHLNPAHPGALTPETVSPLRTLREQAVMHPLREEFDHILVNDTYFRGVSLVRLPERAHPGYTHGLLSSLWPDCDLVLTIDTLDTEAAISRLKLSNNITRTLAFSTWTKNYEAEQKHLELDELITEMRGSAQRLFRFSFSVLLRAASLDELRAKTTPVLNAFRDFGSAEAASDDMSHFRTYLTAMPGHGELADRKYYVQTKALAAFLPVAGSWRGSRKKKLLLETPMGEILGIDPFDPALAAKHGLILGTTGSGKSFATNYLLSNFLAQDVKNQVVLIDVGGSYRKLADVVKGEYLEVELSERFGFNPFPVRGRITARGEFDGDAVAYLSLLMSRMCLEPGEAVTVADKVFLEKAIKGAYAKKEEIVLGDVREELEKLAKQHPGARRYVEALELWTTGMYGKLFNRSGALDVANRVVVFDLQNLENHPDLQSVYFFVIRSLIWGKLQDRSLKKIIAIDEGWKFFNDAVGAELIENLYRTARKFNGAVYSISQSPKDFLDTKAANAIISNSYVKFVLKLSKGYELLPQFELNSNEVEAVKHLQSKPGEFSDVLLKFGSSSVVARLEPSPFEYWICTTNAEDRIKEDGLREMHPDLSAAQILLKLAEVS
ncbi:MAG: ATP-binding protein [Elusimicrobiota bacterium]